MLEGAAVAHAHVDERLRELLHRVPVGQVAAAERFERQQRGRDAVARGHEVAVDDVARLLAAERPVALAQRLEHVAVADDGGRDLDAVLAPSRCGSRSWSSPSRRRRRRGAGRPSRRWIAASAISSSPSTTTPLRSTASMRSPSPSNAKPATSSPVCIAARSRPMCVEPQFVVDVAAVGLVGEHADVGAEAAEDLRRGAERRAVGAVEQDPLAGQVEVGEALVQRAQVVLERAVERAHAAGMLRDRRAAARARPRSRPRWRPRACSRRRRRT